MLDARFSYRGEKYGCDARSGRPESDASPDEHGRSRHRAHILDMEYSTVTPHVRHYNKVQITRRLEMKPESLSRAFGKLRDCGVSVRQSYTNIVVLREFALEGPANIWSKM